MSSDDLALYWDVGNVNYIPEYATSGNYGDALCIPYCLVG